MKVKVQDSLLEERERMNERGDEKCIVCYFVRCYIFRCLLLPPCVSFSRRCAMAVMMTNAAN